MKTTYSFGQGRSDGNATQKELLGGKGANLAEMVNLGLPVPPGFTITTEVCKYYYENSENYPNTLSGDVDAAVARMEECLSDSGAKFGSAENPLLVSVRSGAPVSMPGMMDTILNLGLNDVTVQGLKKQAGDGRFAYDSYRRFIQMYADVVMGVHSNAFEAALEEKKIEQDVLEDTELSEEALIDLVRQFKMIVVEQSGKQFPEDPKEQLWGAIGAVFSSWNNPRALTYRKINNIPASYGTAVNVQAMVFGNMGGDCATGVAFTRDPSTGDPVFFGEFLINAQGEDVVAGIRTPQPINKESLNATNKNLKTLEAEMPKVYGELVDTYKKLESHYRDMQDIEFTIQKDKLFLLQTRSGKRTASAAVRIAVDLHKEGVISKEEAIMRVSPDQLDQLLHPRLDPEATKETLARGLPASPGAVSGKVVFDPDVAEDWVNNKNEQVLLVRIETSPEDIHGMNVANGILTARGGMTSHAAVVARGMGKSCVAGCAVLDISYEKKQMTVAGKTIKQGDWLTLDGASGDIIMGQVRTVMPEFDDTFAEFMGWVDEVRTLKVRTNADSPKDAQIARNFGAQGIGLCRTEHMFFEPHRISAVRQMILSDTSEERAAALAKIEPFQTGDFYGLFEEMQELPVTIRLLDPPLHEFMPQSEADVVALAQEMQIPLDRLHRRISALHEFNPMLGHRGCRLGITYPEIYRMQVRAIIKAACKLKKEKAVETTPEIMVPLIAGWRELKIIRDYCEDEIGKCFAETGCEVAYQIGTMIELPRAALTADSIADPKQGNAEFFSFGTNDLTQTCYGLSRDDSGRFLPEYVENGIFATDPFVSVDQEGVGELMRIATDKGRATRKGMKLGICGEHGGEARSVEFCFNLGLDYVSCSPFRVPLARLAAAQAEIKNKK